MSGSTIALAVEGLVMVLLLFTIGYCAILNTRLKRLRSDEQSLKAMIAELVTATEIADRAVRALKATVGEADRTLGQRIRDAETARTELDRCLETLESSRSRPVVAPEPVQLPLPVPVALPSAPIATLQRLAAASGRPAFAGLRTR